MTINKELIQQILDIIENEPEKHYQRHWFSIKKEVFKGGVFNWCNTACCVAGLAVALTYNNFELEDDCDFIIVGKTNIGHVRNVARELLGITKIDANMLFWSENSVEEIKELLNTFLEDSEELN